MEEVIKKQFIPYVQAALKAASEKAIAKYSITEEPPHWKSLSVHKDSILNAYSLDDIK